MSGVSFTHTGSWVVSYPLVSGFLRSPDEVRAIWSKMIESGIEPNEE